MTGTDATTIRRTVTVPLSIDDAFDTFTARFGEIKPPEHNLLDVPIAETVLEPRVGGGIVDRGTDGSVCRWARILAYDPPNSVVFSWDISPRWELETDPERASEVEVRFVAAGPRSTTVELEHRHLDRHGAGWEGFGPALGGERGWPLYLARFAELVPSAG